MKKTFTAKVKGARLPVLVERGEDGFYVVECPVFRGCYTQGKTLDEALHNIREVIDLILEEKENQLVLKSYKPQEVGLHTITL
ncbi:MAG: type II toxin-antitoxin system HicB family antitoxin [bacterium]|nr:type II toxin-antitoxin system HicB family antitoxin [bacterium]